MDFFTRNHDSLMLFMDVMIVVLLVMITWMYYKKECFSEPHAYTSGASQRFQGEFTMPGQGTPNTIYNMKRRKEGFTNPKSQVSQELTDANRYFYRL